MLSYELQLFAKDGPGGEKTENATPKKLRDARKEGQVAKSKELGLGIGLLVMFLMLKLMVGMLGSKFMDSFTLVYNQIPDFTSLVAGNISVWDYMILFREIMIQVLLMMLPFMGVALVAGIIIEVYQVKWAPTTKPLKPKLSKMNPINGFKKFFSLNALIELLKAVLKITLIIWVAYSTLKKEWDNLFILYEMPIEQAIALMGDIVIGLGIKISLIYLIIAFADLFYQKWKFKEDMKMTKQEVKDEYKQAEGDPKIKGKIRQRMMQASQRRMMQDLPKADVVITNPTHFAVAIKYDADLYDAPYVVAKGSDHLAAKIKEVAKENKVEIVENKPLARMLYYNVELGSVIPPELYRAVADILAMVYKMQGKI
ncbi:MAG: flagellar biosynthesis protein FlhB [Lachnospiraceae bacterium]|nr:flagellar biosynthesis protein FlhB [Lachnospiraceae bacterium]